MLHEILAVIGALCVALLFLAIFGRLIFLFLMACLVVFLGVPFLLTLLIILIPVFILYGICEPLCFKSKCSTLHFSFSDDDEDNSSRIIINGEVVKCDKCNRNACRIFNNNRRCNEH